MTLLLFLSMQDSILSLYLSRQNTSYLSNGPWTTKAPSKLATGLRMSLTIFRDVSWVFSIIGHHISSPVALPSSLLQTFQAAAWMSTQRTDFDRLHVLNHLQESASAPQSDPHDGVLIFVELEDLWRVPVNVTSVQFWDIRILNNLGL